MLLALHSTRDHLAKTVLTIEDEDQQNLVYDHIERLDGMIPIFECELNEHLAQAAASIEPSLLYQSS